MPRPVLLVLGICWIGANRWMLVGARDAKIPMGSREKVETRTTSSRLAQLPIDNSIDNPGTDGKVAKTTREEGDWCRSISDTERVPGKLTFQRGGGGEAASACVGLGAVDACSLEKGRLRLASSSRRRASIALSRGREKRQQTRPVFRLRGGEAPKTHETGAHWNMDLFGWSTDSESVTKEKEAVRARRKHEMDEADAREVLRHKREDRLEREMEEKGASESEDQMNGGGGILESLVPGGIARHRASGGDSRLWLDVAEGIVGGMSLVVASMRPLWHTIRGMFGLSLLFYGEEFATLAFHIIVFRLSGWKKAAKSKNELVAYYIKARQAMSKAAKDVRASAAIMAKKDRMLARKEEMMAEKKKLLKMGHVTPAEARAFIDKYRRDIEIIAREQEVLATASSSVLAIKGALSLKKLAASVNGLYSAVVTSITASTFKRAGQLTLALTCGGLIKRTLFDLLGPMIDPIGYQIELESYVANIMRGPANVYVGIVGYVSAVLMFFHFFVDPHKALTITFVLLGARVVTDYIVAALNPVRWRFGMSKKIDNMPLSALIYITLATMGFVFHGDAGLVGDYACRPYIAFLGILNNLLNRFQISTISYFT